VQRRKLKGYCPSFFFNIKELKIMVSWKTEYNLYKQNIKVELIGKYLQLFYNTKPTNEQLEILDMREKLINAVFVLSLLFGIILGIIFSYVLYLFLKDLSLLRLLGG
jgi:hypothetical protein